MPSRNEIIAEAIRELADGQDEIRSTQDRQEQLLTDIKSILITVADGLGQHRQHTLQAVDDLGSDMRNVRSRVDALEKVAGRVAE
jgi:hypothetical protein